MHHLPHRRASLTLAAAAIAAALLSTSTRAAVTLTVDTTAPTGPSVVVANPHSSYSTSSLGPLGERDTFTTAFPAANSGGIGTRGQTFLMPDNPTGTAWDLSSITIRADANPDGSGVSQPFTAGGPNTMRLWVFQWAGTGANDCSQWTAGDGASDGDPLNGTGVTNVLVNGAPVDITRSFNGDFLHFSIPAGVQLAENTPYALLVSVESASGTAGLKLDQIRDNTDPKGEVYANGANIQSNTSANTINSSGDDLVFYVQATPALTPEPTTLSLLTLPAASLLRRRRPR